MPITRDKLMTIVPFFMKRLEDNVLDHLEVLIERKNPSDSVCMDMLVAVFQDMDQTAEQTIAKLSGLARTERIGS